MDLRRILLISDEERDYLLLADCLERARPTRFRLLSCDSLERPLEVLADPELDIVIMVPGPETEYLLRLMQKSNIPTPVMLLLDAPPNGQEYRLFQDCGVKDYLIREQLQHAFLDKVLDYAIELNRARNTIRDLSNRDSLTGVLNRAGFRAQLEQTLQHAQRHDLKTALLYLNIDQFTSVNDHFGEHNGDLLIQQLSRRILNKLRNTDAVARLGGDEFAIILENVSSASDVATIAGKLLQTIAMPVLLEEQQVQVNASIGAALYPDDAGDLAELLEQARSAMQQAKPVTGSKFIHYSERLLFDAGGGNSLAAELRTAVRKNQFELHYQPRVILESGQLAGLEALLRWNHPERGLTCPGEFLAECEDMGLMKNIGHQIIQHACCALNWMAEQGLGDIVVAVNISFSQIQDDHFVGAVKDILDRTGANAARLEFELTENTILKSPSAIKARMEELGQLGISFSLDDFGTGFSQLSHLTELPISALKIDSSFVRDLPHNRQQAAVCSLIIQMARRLELEVVAEGAESYEQIEYLRAEHCHQVQGFYYSPAIPLQQLPRFVQEQRFKYRERISS
ncbi:putative bifunctional diguanylate cyclase/phosphodiesterase [Kineobactrum salinum]|uniref:Bifunctional diguanylate cyclase/phosphodiesterase n=1 Tax=Kineobactrum salinum TaxID=2708301 RepID=A0A6C0U2P1_9GAMM|nr:bifunctional diguanylate cyclase/phosphodiesterase [Kineobactrum salinum]QIB66296.1 bifunctional diguanylate cyclase/phosphodiesterase [Kineobactrum salinum]